MKLRDCLLEKVGIEVSSPRLVFKNKRRPQDYTIESVDVDLQRVLLTFRSGTPISLDFWRFNEVIDCLEENNERWVRVGSSVDPSDPDTIEFRLFKTAEAKGFSAANLRTAPFVCDLLAICGIIEYELISNPRTGRKVQAVRLLARGKNDGTK